MPMKPRLLLPALFILLPAVLAAEDTDKPEYKHEWRFGLSGYPVLDNLLFGDSIIPDFDHFDTDYIYSDYHGAKKMIGLLSAEYNFNRSRKVTLSVAAHMTGAWYHMYDYTGRRKYTQLGLSCHLIPTVRYNYVVRPAFTFYGSLGFGAIFGLDDGEFAMAPTFQITPMGITFGRKVFGFAETSAGLSYIGGRVGIGYRF